MDDWIVEITTVKRETLSLPDGATMHFTSRQVAKRYVKDWKERHKKENVKVKYIKYQEANL